MNQDLQLSAIRNRAQFARDLIGSEHFQEVIQGMNEQVLVQLSDTDPLDSDALQVLRLRLGAISDFVHRLDYCMSAYEEVLAQERMRLRQEEMDDEYRDTSSVRGYTK